MATAASNANEVSDIEGPILDSVEAFLSAPHVRAALRRQRMGQGEAGRDEFDRKVWSDMADMGWLGVLAHEEAGGLGLEPGAALRVATLMAERFGTYVSPEPFSAVAGVTVSVLSACNNETAQHLLSDVVSGARIIATALGAGACSAKTFVNGWRLQGEIKHIGPGQPVDGWIVLVKGDKETALVFVAANAPGMSVTTQVTADGRSLASLRFENCEIPNSALLSIGEKADAALANAQNIGRLLVAAELLGAGRAALNMTLDYLKLRKQFGQFIGAFQALQHRSVDAFIHLEIAQSVLHEALREIAQHPDDAALALFQSNRAKARCGEAALQTVRAAVQLHGAIGITDEADIGLFFKRVMTLLPRFGGIEASRSQCQDVVLRNAVGATSEQSWDAAHADSGDWDAMSEDQFRSLIRSFLKQNYPDHLRYMPRRVHWPEIADWYGTLSRKGWIAPAWPKEYGGMGLPPDKLIAYIEEFENYGIARAPDQGIVMVGPVLMRYGSPEQRAHFLPKIISGEHIWCQGYSEPGSGSDLASLRTSAVEDGDHFVVNGQKIWTTLAQDANHIFMLVRTDPTARKQAGISFLLCDLATPGITIRTIRDMAGHEEFCEVFFDNVRVPRSQLVGELNQGWEIAKALLGFERIFLGSPKQSQYALGQLRQLAQATGLFNDPVFTSKFIGVQLDVLDLGAAYRHYVDMAKRGEPLPPSVSLLKIWATETYQRIAVLLAESAGAQGALLDSAIINDASFNVLAPLFHSAAASIYGGSNEIQRNILAKAVLGLPS